MEPDTIRPIPENEVNAALARILTKVRERGDALLTRPKEGLLDKGVLGYARSRSSEVPREPVKLGEALLGQAPEFVSRRAAGFPLFKERFGGISGRLPEIRDPEKPGLADALFSAPIGGPGARSVMGVVKQGGGTFSKTGKFRLIEGVAEGQPEHVRDWIMKAGERYLTSKAGTAADRANTIRVGGAPESPTYESLMDASLRKKRFEDLEPHAQPDRPPVAGEPVWHFDPKPELSAYYKHVGDVAAAIPPDELRKMDFQSLLKYVERIDNTSRTAKRSRAMSAAEEASIRHTEEHPAQLKVPTASGNTWLKFTREGMDPEQIKRGLSNDTCIGNVCVGAAAHDIPSLGYANKWMPLRDPRTGQRFAPDPLPPRLADPRSNYQKDTNAYISKILEGKGHVWSLREGGIPRVAFETVPTKETGVPRSTVQDLNPGDYLRWQNERRLAGEHPEQRVQLSAPIRRTAEAGGGHIIPTRPNLSPEEVRAYAEKHPRYRDMLEEYMRRPPHTISEFRGAQNQGAPMQYAPDAVELMRQEMSANRLLLPDRRILGSQLDVSGIGVSNELSALPQMADEAIRRGAALPGARRPGDPVIYPNIEEALATVRDIMIRKPKVLTPQESAKQNQALRIIAEWLEANPAPQLGGPGGGEAGPGGMIIPTLGRPRR